VIDLMTLALDGTLDGHDRQDLARMPARDAATQHYDGELARCRSPRDWWQVAERPGGEPVGFVFPAATTTARSSPTSPCYPPTAGTVTSTRSSPRARGSWRQDVPGIRATTDLGNVPVAAAFTRAGWVNVENSVNMVWG
jgi:hypothetical protein